VKKILRDPPAPFSRMVTLKEFHTVIAYITDAELMTWPGIGRKTAAELRQVWASHAVRQDQTKAPDTSVTSLSHDVAAAHRRDFCPAVGVDHVKVS
jgi:hypothetical protein